MKEIQTLPQSLQAQLQKAQELLAAGQQSADMGNRAKAIALTQQGLNAIIEISHKHPALGTFLMGALQGERYFEIKIVEENLTHPRESSKESPYSYEYVPVKNVKTTTTSYRFGAEEADEPAE